MTFWRFYVECIIYLFLSKMHIFFLCLRTFTCYYDEKYGSIYVDIWTMSSESLDDTKIITGVSLKMLK